MVDGDFSKHNLDMTVKHDQTPGLCVNEANENCCSCFKEQDSDFGCNKMRCFHNGLDGICVGKNDPYPHGYMKTDVRCLQDFLLHSFTPCTYCARDKIISLFWNNLSFQSHVLLILYFYQSPKDMQNLF